MGRRDRGLLRREQHRRRDDYDHDCRADDNGAAPSHDPGFQPGGERRERAYFASLWKSIKAAQIDIKRQQRVVESNPTVSNQTDLVGLQQNCTTVVATYNAAALAIVSKAFRSAGLPSQISPAECSPPKS